MRGLRALIATAALCLSAAGAAEAQPVAIRGADPERYALDLRYLDRGAGVLRGTERIELVNRGPVALDRVWLRLWANGPDRCRPRRIAVKVAAPAVAVSEQVDCTALEVQLGEPLAPGASGSLSLRFRVRGRREPDRFGRVGGTTLLGNVIPVLAVEDDRGLHLEPYTAFGESFYTLSARWQARLTVPRRLRAVTTGAVRSEQVGGGLRTLRVASRQARDFGLAVGRLSSRSGRVRGTRVRVFASPGTRASPLSLRVARRALRMLGGRLGAYRARELDVLLLPRGLGDLFAGMEYPELVFAVPIPDVVSHEVAHQWWYGLVGNDQWNDPWLDESFAQYSHERLHPRVNRCRPEMPYALVREAIRSIPLDSSMGVFEATGPFALGEIVYAAGSCALQRLERDIGRARMTAFLRLLQRRFRHGVMRESDVLGAIAEVAPEYDLATWMALAHLRR